MRHRIKFMRFNACRWFNQTELHKIEIAEMYNQKNKYYCSCMDHVFGKKRCMRKTFYLVSVGPRHPIVYLDYNTNKDMDKKSSEKHYFKYLDQRIGGHKMNRFGE